MFVIVDDGGRVVECGDGCLLDDRAEVEVPEGWDARHMHDWVLEGGRLVLQPVETEQDRQRRVMAGQIQALADQQEFHADCIAELAAVAYDK